MGNPVETTALVGAAGTPGVSDIVGPGHATIVLTAYLVAFCAIGGWLLYRRDIA